uniref:N-acetyltransferase domain-containing protein n=1 Tax=Hemiselmis andersenii TaxID=464988 RepID=A0A6U4V3F5_HEMAN|mmetsp:Transcript_34096/g.79885  ORF Transcript_34096/g.79885 Transcript_34096/m.79885 type:complete len:193 (+) Transcript_34096:86-664(+)
MATATESITEAAIVDINEGAPGQGFTFEQKYKEKLPVRLGELTDKVLEQLKTLNKAVFPVKYNDKFYADVAASGTYTKLAYYSTDILVGAICCRLEKPAAGGAGGTRLYIMTIGVLAPYRSCGVGTEMLEQTLSDAEKDPSVSEAYLHVQTSNTDAMEFYKRFGFEVTSTIKNYYKKIEPPDCHVLTKTFAR